MQRTIYLVFFLILLPSGLALAQTDEEEPSAIRILSKADPSGIILRWAPSNHILWQYANKYGYRVEKYLLLRDGELLARPLLLPSPDSVFKPQPLDVWEQYALKDTSNAALYISAQAIYGNSFQSENKTGNKDLMDIVNQVQEQEMRFTYHLISADRSLEVAQLSGLFWEDKAVKKGEKYLYKIFAQVPADICKADTGFVYTGIDDYQPLPKPYDVQGEFGNKAVLLSWNYLYLSHIYSSYFIERSDDGGKTYFKTGKEPVSNPIVKDSLRIRPYFFKIDSLPQNNQIYYFRLRGLDAFGEEGPPSDSIFGKGTDKLGAITTLKPPLIHPDGNVVLNWDFPEAKNGLIEGFVVEKSEDVNGFYKPLHPDRLAPSVRQFKDSVSIGAVYYRVRTIVNPNEQLTSLSQMVQIADSIPPALPSFITGNIDSTGIALIRWNPSVDKDIMGYRIFRSENEKTEFAQVSTTPVKDTLYKDSVDLNNLNSKLYYKIQAVDRNYNQSPMSEAVLLTRPDTLPPTSPVFTDVLCSDSSIVLQWANSSSSDVKEHQLYRLRSGTEAWELIAVIPIAGKDQQYFSDTSTARGIEYFYTVLAVDQNRLESKPAPAIGARKIDTGVRPALKGFKAVYSPEEQCILLQWDRNNQVEEYMIFKGKTQTKTTQYKTIGAEIGSFKDFEIKVGETYRYCIKANCKDNSQTKFTTEISVEVR